MSSFQPRFQVLPDAQRELWPGLSSALKLGLVLYGGTAIALRLGHRTSIDFDFFSEKPLHREDLYSGFRFLEDAKVIQSQPDTLSVLASAGGSNVKVSFFGSITIGRAGNPDQTPDGILEVASMLDLLATKLKVIQQRIEAKDYFDIASILKSGAKLEDGLAAAAALYPSNFQPSEALKALTYFEGGDLDQLDKSDRSVLSHAASSLRKIPTFALASRSLSSAPGSL